LDPHGGGAVAHQGPAGAGGADQAGDGRAPAGIVGQLTVEEIVKQPEMVADRMRSTSADDMDKMGLEIVSFTIKEVRDQNEYIMNMGRPDIVSIKRAADIATAAAARDSQLNSAQARA